MQNVKHEMRPRAVPHDDKKLTRPLGKFIGLDGKIHASHNPSAGSRLKPV